MDKPTESAKSYRDLHVWNRAMDLVEEVYRLSRSFPAEEKFGLTSQLRRAVVSVPANIVEGYGRTHRREYTHHLSIARGSLLEVETLLIIAGRLEFAQKEDAAAAWRLCQETGKMLLSMIRSLREKP